SRAVPRVAEGATMKAAVATPAEATHTTGTPPVVCGSFSVHELSQQERRFESEAYLTGGYAIRHAIQSSNVAYRRMVELADIWMPGRLKGIKVAPGSGKPFFAATQVFDIQPVARKWLAPSHTADLENRFVQRGWLLVTCSGNVGEAIIAYAPHEGVIIS